MWEENQKVNPKGIGSSDKDFGLDGIPTRFKIRIPLRANNSLGYAR
jgi:hypothetical protein